MAKRKRRKYKLSKKKIIRTILIFAVLGSIIIYFNINKLKKDFSKNEEKNDIAVLSAPTTEDKFGKIMEKYGIKGEMDVLLLYNCIHFLDDFNYV